MLNPDTEGGRLTQGASRTPELLVVPAISQDVHQPGPTEQKLAEVNAPRVKAPKPPRVPFDPKRVMPHKGVRGVVYHSLGVKKLFELTGWRWILALFPLSNGELEELLSTKLNEVTTHQEVVAITLNQKGGAGKSPVAACLAEMIALTTQQATLAVDANQARGSTASRIGTYGTLTGRQCLDVHESLVQSGSALTRALLDKLLERHRMPGYGSLRVLQSNTDKENLSPTSYERNLAFYQALRGCTHSLVFDGGNSLSAHAPIMNAAIKLSDVLVFVARPAEYDSVVHCVATMEHYYKNVCPEKVARSVVVIVGHKKGEPDAKQYSQLFKVPEQQIVLVPFDPFFNSPKVRSLDDPTDPVELEKLNRVTAVHLLQRKTRIAYLELALLVFQQAAKASPVPVNTQLPQAPPVWGPSPAGD
jgi:MinD-like ATPase involved in chromosome partitioning or flagellar assembly